MNGKLIRKEGMGLPQVRKKNFIEFNQRKQKRKDGKFDLHVVGSRNKPNLWGFCTKWMLSGLEPASSC